MKFEEIWETETTRHPRIDPSMPFREGRSEKVLSVIGRVSRGGVEVVLFRHCDDRFADRHMHYWDLPCDGLFRVNSLGMDWYGEKERFLTEQIENAVINEVEKYKKQGMAQ